MILIIIGLAILILILLYLGLLALIIKMSLYPPRIHQYISPGMMGFPQETIKLKTKDDLTLEGWWTENPGDVTFVACHGYIVNRCEWVPLMSFLADEKASFLFFDHRGQGRSQRAKVTFGEHEEADVEAAVEFVKTRKPDSRIVLIGSSMGSVASAKYASKHPDDIQAVILDAPYRSLDEAMRGWWIFLAGPLIATILKPAQMFAKMLLGFHPKVVRSDEALAKYPGPKLLFYGLADPLIPEDSARSVAESLGEESTVVFFDGETHGAGRLNQPRKFQTAVLEFLTKHKLRS